MERIPIASTSLASVGYDAETQTLEVEFNTGRVYQYYSVPEQEHPGLLNADSKGTYFNANIRNGYSYSRL